MSDLEYRILSAISLAGTAQWSAVVNMFLVDHPPVTIDAILHVMLDRKWICRHGSSSEPPLCYIRLDSAGILALETEKSVRQEIVRKEQEQEQKTREQVAAAKADRKAERRADRIFQIFLALLQTLLTFVSGLLTEHFFGIFEWILSVL